MASEHPHHKTEEAGVRADISNRIVGLHKQYYGKGPTKAKTFIQDDTVLVILQGGFTRVEETLLSSGQGNAVIEQRGRWQVAMEEPFKRAITEATGREVIAFLSASHQHPDYLAEIFILAPAAQSRTEADVPD